MTNLHPLPIIIALAIPTSPVHAATTHTVKSDGSGTHPTIQAAVDAANPGDTVLVHPGIYNQPHSSWKGTHGRNAYRALFNTVRAGTRTAPITIRAAHPARQPLVGGAWAENDPARQTILDGRTPDGEHLPMCALLLHSDVILDGFVVKNGAAHGIYGSRAGKAPNTAAKRLSIRNCKFLANSVERAGENSASLTLGGWGVPDCCVQNNHFETPNGCALGLAGARNGVVEYNEFRDWANYAIYAHGGKYANNDLVIRYNYFHGKAARPLMRIRDSLRYEVHHNVVTGVGRGIYFDDHGPEHPDFPDDCYAAHHNTIVSDRCRNAFAIGFQRATHPQGAEKPTCYNIIAGDIEAAVNIGPWGSPSRNVHIVRNVIAPGIKPVNGHQNALAKSSWTQTDNIIADPQLDGHYRSRAFDNAIYGANLDVSRIPYRKSDGTLWPIHNPYVSPADAAGVTSPERTP
ncbi:MAG: right-handed parallel beta-helix repeat-containing protein [Kiritimatiellae bacterium]|nr:right-handed parallel beta-helix repeat-containing protein [Kiritimatiellia bacterium]